MFPQQSQMWYPEFFNCSESFPHQYSPLVGELNNEIFPDRNSLVFHLFHAKFSLQTAPFPNIIFIVHVLQQSLCHVSQLCCPSSPQIRTLTVYVLGIHCHLLWSWSYTVLEMTFFLWYINAVPTCPAVWYIGDNRQLPVCFCTTHRTTYIQKCCID